MVSKIIRIFVIEMIEIKDIHGKLLATIDADTLEFADLSKLNLCYADFRYANLMHANLAFTDLTFADLTMADLSEADLEGTEFGGAIVDGTEFPPEAYHPHYM